MEKEIWKPAPGYVGVMVSDQGRVRGELGHILRGGDNGSGYIHVEVRTDDGERRHKYVHRLVLETFVGPCPPGMQACHWDDVPTNNALSNLRWDTPSENMRDRVRNGGSMQANKTHCSYGHPFNERNTLSRDGKEHWRRCRACIRARSVIKKSDTLTLGDFQDVSDHCFWEVMNPEKAKVLNQKKVCPRGHPLIDQNLIPSALKRGARACLSCSRAHARVQKYPELETEFEAIANSYFAAIEAETDDAGNIVV